MSIRECLKYTTIPDVAKLWTWTASDGVIIKVSTSGVIKGLKPRNFTLSTKREGKRLTPQGFIMPANWNIKIEPNTVTMKVGQFVEF
ncbi:hypothetical protein IQ266_20780 [filamentous cyanobacterium LEGE 11480]|uniref:Uncharacterized protein n=1 Tax=Romeriopsis navalis LEGE 11480 TaxID=2777977 RepID=A0A928Z632_9CYAN|nr:hypothetical protein [Romeriopsis navalis]MBE9032178.1 hypothetical protein [Romeriopsis navalis LEGE 11480]